MKKRNQIRLAIVDDAPFIREVIRTIVENEKSLLLVGEAQNGEEAVELAKSCDIDVMIMDLVMPVKNGIDATLEILAMKPNLKIIACSTVDQETMVMKALDSGCCSYLVKPFEAQQLVQLIVKSFSE